MDLFDTSWIILALAALGMLTIGFVTLALFSSLGRRPGRIWTTDVPSITSPDFMHCLSGSLNVPVFKGGSAKVLNNGDAFFPRMLDTISQAEHTINFMTYYWEPGQVSDQFLKALTTKACEGVGVRLLLDGIGCHTIPKDDLKNFQESGGKVAWFHPIAFGNLTRIHKRNHRRAIVIDGSIGYTGGAGVSDKWKGDARSSEEWRDVMVEVKGCLALTLQSAFAQLWSDVSGEILSGEEFYPDSEMLAHSEDYIIKHVNVVSSPTKESHPLRKLYWLSLASARKSIYITNPYFVPDRHMRYILKAKARSGVDIRILTAGKHTDAQPVRLASQSRYEELLSEGIKIYEYEPSMIHTKVVVVDGVWSMVGSANFDVRSKELNQENILGMLDENFAKDLTSAFYKDVERSKMIKLDEWRKRSWFRRIAEKVFVIFEEQY